MMNSSKNKIFLVDGNAYIHRAYHALPPLTTSSGLPINAVFGFIRMIFKILKNFRPEYFCICLDSEKPTFRHKIYKEYKATRKELEEDIKIQFPIVKEFIVESGIPYLLVDGYEADDIISYLVKKFIDDYEIVIISGDKDILQLVNEKVLVYNEHKDIWYNEEEVKKKYGVVPSILTDFFSLVGDKIDNITGLDGVGPKTAAELLLKFGSIEGIYSNLDKLKDNLKKKFLEHKEEIYKSKELVSLATEVLEIENVTLENIKITQLNIDKIKEFLLKYEMRTIIREIDKLPYTNLNQQQYNESEDLLFSYSTLTKKEPEVLYLNNLSKLDEFFKIIQKVDEVISCIVYKEQTNELIGCIGVIYTGTDKTLFYAPFVKHVMSDNNFLFPLEQELVKKLISFLFFDNKINVISYDIKSQVKKMSAVYQLDINRLSNKIYDVLLLSHLIKSNKKIISLQELVSLWSIQRPVSEIALPKEVSFELFPVEKFVSRMRDTLETTYEVYQKISNEGNYQDIKKVYESIELLMVKILIKMETHGIMVDKQYIENLRKEIEEEINSIKHKIFELAGFEFNLNSPKQIAFVLFEKLKLPPIKKKKTGYSTDEEVLITLENVHPIVSLILKHRELEKLKNTYLEPISQYINPSTGRIHTTFNITGTVTGRLSSEEPNLQNIPVKTDWGKKIRSIFVPQKDHKFVSLDYSQIELRILAHFSNDKTLITAFFDNKDIHKSTASEIFNIPEENIDENLRRVAKIINFGIVYGMTPQGLAKELKISVSEAEEYIKKYFDKYSEVKTWVEETIKFAKLNCYVKTLFGRIRYIPEINSTNKSLQSFGTRLAVNTPIQGTAAEIIKLAMIKIDEFITKENLNEKIKMLVQIHDELLFEIHNDVLNSAVEKIKYIMENVVKLKVPLVVDTKILSRWGEE
jgi:DNA polymerase-1